ncbi:hypothetical protein [Hungatella hathewayi]|uniref:hypothetical protein n=1 Tax=Hungatella hathewayi TaxID=154046 RepID=UPI0035635616
MENYYEGSFYLELKEDIPEDLMKLLKKLQTRKEDEIVLADNIDDGWKEFNFTFGIRFQNDHGIQYINHIYEELYVKDMIEGTGCVQKICGYYIDIDICTMNYKIGSFDRFLAFIKPHMSDNNNFCLGIIEDEDGTYKQGYFFDKDMTREDMEKHKAFCEGCNLSEDLLPCSFEPLCMRAFLKGKENVDVR